MEKQKELIADIGIFERLSEIADEMEISQTEWARVSWPNAKRNQQPRISELKRISELMQTEGITQDEASRRVKRDCTFPKMFALRKGLIQMLGVKAVQKRIDEWEKYRKRKRKSSHSEREREVNFFFMWFLLKDKDKDKVLDLMSGLVDKDPELNS